MARKILLRRWAYPTYHRGSRRVAELPANPSSASGCPLTREAGSNQPAAKASTTADDKRAVSIGQVILRKRQRGDDADAHRPWPPSPREPAGSGFRYRASRRALVVGGRSIATKAAAPTTTPDQQIPTASDGRCHPANTTPVANATTNIPAATAAHHRQRGGISRARPTPARFRLWCGPDG